MPNTSKSSLDNLLKSILSVISEEQNAIYPPAIFSQQVNVITALLLNKLVKMYPGDPISIDMLSPFMMFAMQPVQNGIFSMPLNYRNILGAPYVFKKDCSEVPQITTYQQFLTAQLKGGCSAVPITIVSESEYSVRTSSTYKRPTHENPIGYFTMQVNGQTSVKVCPYDLGTVAVLYVRQEKTYTYGYIPQPDDTYIFDPTTTVDSEWGSSAFQPIFDALLSLFSAYVKDPEMTSWSRILSQEGLL